MLLLLLFSTITSDAASPTGVPPSPSMVCREPTDKGYCGEAPCWGRRALPTRCCYTHAAQDVTTKCLASCSSLVLKPPLFSRKKTLRSSKQVPSHIHVAAAHTRMRVRTIALSSRAATWPQRHGASTCSHGRVAVRGCATARVYGERHAHYTAPAKLQDTCHGRRRP